VTSSAEAFLTHRAAQVHRRVQGTPDVATPTLEHMNDIDEFKKSSFVNSKKGKSL
jgi:hypothetical protein